MVKLYRCGTVAVSTLGTEDLKGSATLFTWQCVKKKPGEHSSLSPFSFHHMRGSYITFLTHNHLEVGLLNGANRKLCGNHWFQSPELSGFAAEPAQTVKQNEDPQIDFPTTKPSNQWVFVHVAPAKGFAKSSAWHTSPVHSGGARYAIDENLHRRSVPSQELLGEIPQ